MKKKTRERSIFYRVFLPLLVMVFLQALILYGILYFNGVFAGLNQNSLKLLEERTQNKEQNLMSSMVNSWSNLLPLESTIDELTQNVLTENGKDWQDIKSDAALNGEIVKACTDALIQKLRNNKTTGIYMILDGIGVYNEPDSYAGVYIRNADPSTDNVDNSDLLVLRGLPEISRKWGIPLHSFWKAGFTFEGKEEDTENLFFFNPLRKAEEIKTTKSQYLGYWSSVFSIEKSGDARIITYSMPLINTDGDVYGVVGVDITESYLTAQISNELNGMRENCFYYLGITEDGGQSYRRVASSGNTYNIENINAEKVESDENAEFIRTGSQSGQMIYGSVSRLKLYNNNTPFENEQWVLIGFQAEASVFSAAQKTQKLIFLGMAAAVLVGSIIAVFAGRSIVSPITRLVQGVRKKSENAMTELPCSHVREIDELAAAIEAMNHDILESALRTSGLIEHSGLPVGVYEIRSGMDRAYCSEGFIALMGCSDKLAADNQITVDDLESVISEVMQKPVEENVYSLESGTGIRYLRIVHQEDEKGSKIGAVLDVTEEICSRRRIEKERDYDALTGIWNRRAFENRLNYLFSEQKTGLGTAALVMMDLDNLKFLNDAYGHDCGDEYIRSFAGTLRSCQNNHIVFARRSGDEFYMFLYGYSSKEEGEKEIMRIWEYLGRQTIVLPDNSTYRLRASGGIAWYPENADTPGKLVHYADFAMYQIKHSQKGSLQFFSENEYSRESFLFNAHEALNRLIDNQMVNFMLQPIFETRTGNIFGYEFLMRSNVEELKTPDVILRMAKSQGKLHYIEKLTWLKALEGAHKLIQNKVIDSRSYLFINSIADQNLFSDEIEEVVEKYSDLLPHVVMEVTEGEERNADYTQEKIAFVHSHGGLVAIDDFGTGYNSELALMAIPSNIVKIDISLVRDVDSSPDKQLLIQNLISYARKRNIAVLAEGVETRAEMQQLVRYGIDYLQGYYLGRPKYVPEGLSEEVRKELMDIQK